MSQLDAKEVSDRLEGEDRDLWVHIEADTPLEKYPGKPHLLTSLQLRLTYDHQQSNTLEM